MGTTVLMAAIAHLELFLLEKVAVVVLAPGRVVLALAGRKTMSALIIPYKLSRHMLVAEAGAILVRTKDTTTVSLAGRRVVTVTLALVVVVMVEETLQNPAQGLLAAAAVAPLLTRHFSTLALGVSAGGQTYQSRHELLAWALA
jgi:hypothetical protein